VTDPLHEAKQSLATVKREYTAVSSLNAPTAFTATVACESAIASLCNKATGNDFPYQKFPRHKPGQWVTELGISSYYTPNSQRFLSKIDGYSLDKARYEGTAAFKQYTSPKAMSRGQELVSGVENLISETESLLSNEDALEKVNSKLNGGE
jgi:hypothetical protein